MKREISGQKCPSCETGRQSLLLDRREPFCPYLQFNTGHSCSMYVPLQTRLISKIHKEEVFK